MVNTVGAAIKYYRERLGLNQLELADLLNINNTRLNNWESGVSKPDIEMVVSICVILKITPNRLLNFKSDDDLILSMEEIDYIEKMRTIDPRGKSVLWNALNHECSMVSPNIQQNTERFPEVERELAQAAQDVELNMLVENYTAQNKPQANKESNPPIAAG